MLSVTFNCKVEVGAGKEIQEEKKLLISDIVADVVRKWSLLSFILTREIETIGMQYTCI